MILNMSKVWNPWEVSCRKKARQPKRASSRNAVDVVSLMKGNSGNIGSGEKLANFEESEVKKEIR